MPEISSNSGSTPTHRSQIQDWLEKALAAHQQGHFILARAHYQQVLEVDANNIDALYLFGVLCAQNQQFEEALALLTRASQINPQHTLCQFNRARVLQDLNRLTEAVIAYDQTILSQPDYAQAFCNRGLVLHALGRFNDALESYDQAIRLQPQYPEAFFNRGNLLREMDERHLALNSYEQAIHLNPRYVDALVNQAVVFHELKAFDAALRCYDHAIATDPNNASVYSNRGNTLLELKQFDEAIASFSRAIECSPNYAEAYSNRGLALFRAGSVDDAIKSYQRAIELKPDYADAHNNLASALTTLKRWHEALAHHDRAIQLKPLEIDFYLNKGDTLRRMRCLDEALTHFDQALLLHPNHANAYVYRGAVLHDLRRLPQALLDFDQAIALAPDEPTGHFNRGNTLMELGRGPEALESFDQAIRISPDYADAHFGRGTLLFRMKRLPEAIDSFARALEQQPDTPSLLGLYQHAKMLLCDWDHFETQMTRIETEISARKNCVPTFGLLSLIDQPELQRISSEVFAAENYPPNPALGPMPPRPKRQKIRIGYFSSDFRQHAMGRSLVEFFELHDKSQFEIIGFSFSPMPPDELQIRISRAFDEFIDIAHLADHTVAALSRDKQIDIAVDLNGFTGSCRTSIFAHRAAPVQLQYLGYPGTMGTSYIDYLIADHQVIPSGFETFYSEKIARLPASYQVSDRMRPVTDLPLSKSAFGLPEHGFIFCCFNSIHKITPSTFDSWMRILKHVDGSVLWLIEDNLESVGRRQAEAEKRGVDPSRLIFAPRVPLAQYLDRQRLADLFLDTLPYNAHATASDALWAGLPVLTLAGRSFASRVGASLLNAVGLPELITTSIEEYEKRAVMLATEPGKLSELKQKLARLRPDCALFNTNQTTKHLEAAYTAMMNRYWAGLPPDHINVASTT